MNTETNVISATDLLAAADACQADQDKRHWSNRSAHYLIEADAAIVYVYPAHEDSDGMHIPASRHPCEKGTAGMDLGREYLVPVGVDAVGMRNALLVGRIGPALKSHAEKDEGSTADPNHTPDLGRLTEDSRGPQKPGDPAPLKCSKCGRVHTPKAPSRGDWETFSSCGYSTTLFWAGSELRADGYCDPVIPEGA